MTTTTDNRPLPTQNTEWGFYGTIATAGFRADRAWDVASTLIAREVGAKPSEGLRDFLDSRMGRHFADKVVCGLQRGAPVEVAVEAAIAETRKWWISKATERQEGIPAGLPYLTGWVGHFEILAEATASA